jgi:hypothetical protein
MSIKFYVTLQWGIPTGQERHDAKTPGPIPRRAAGSAIFFDKTIDKYYSGYFFYSE